MASEREQMLRLAEALMQPLRDLGFITPSALAVHAINHQAGGSDPLDHGALPGLGDDDHTIYILADGGRAFTNYVDVNANGIPTAPPVGTIRLYGLLEHGHERIEHMDSDGTRHRMGRDVTIIAKNVSGVQVDKGEMVYINGAVGASGVGTVDFAQADNDATANAVFVAMEDVADNAFGSFMKIGVIRGIDTATPGWSDGTTLFLDTAVAGGLTDVEPPTPYPVVYAGTVLSAHAVNGSIQFNIGTRINPYKPGLLPTPSGSVALTADVNDLALLVGTLPDAQIYIDPDAGGWVINSIVSDAKTRQIWLTNVDASFDFVIANEGTGTAANRIVTGTGGNLTVPALTTVLIVYDVANSRWRVASTYPSVAALGNAQIEEVYTGEAASLGSDTLLTFILTMKPRSTDAVRLYINGALQRNGLDYSVGGLDNKRVTWLADTGTADFAIQATDHITVAYEAN